MQLTNGQWNRFCEQLAKSLDAKQLEIDNDLYARWAGDRWEFYQEGES